jgi:uncharacterized membrane protein YqjE
MKDQRLALQSVIGVTAAVTVIYLAGVFLQLNLALVVTLYLLALISTIWMVVRILKDPYSTDKTFDEYFYQDREDIRRVGKE